MGRWIAQHSPQVLMSSSEGKCETQGEIRKTSELLTSRQP